MSEPIVLGVDRCPRGWLGALIDRTGSVTFRLDRSLGALVEDASGAECVAIDMPIGLPGSGLREADVMARAFVGPRRSSVFMTPPRAVLEAASFEEANKIAPTLLDGAKISQQVWALRATIFEVERVADHDRRIIEVHPEVSFRAIAGQPIPFSKRSWNGTSFRRGALANQGLLIPDVLDHGGDIPAADVLDALAAAWSARRFALGKVGAMPVGAKRDQRAVIWY